MNMIDKQRQRNVPPTAIHKAEPLPAAPHPVDGSQFHNVIEEQQWSEQPPTAEEQAPRRARRRDEPEAAKPHPDDPAISVGDT